MAYHPYNTPPQPQQPPPVKLAPKWARKRYVVPAIGAAFIIGIGAAGSGQAANSDAEPVSARPQPTVTVTATATETVQAKPAPAVTATKTVKVRVTVTAKVASNSGSGGSGGGTGSGSSRHAGTCSIVSNAGNCYSAGQFCRNSDHGATTTTASGARIECAYSANAWRWTFS
ncbi:hypothetical protein PV703_30930 [Streptomyces sp. ME01-24h]|nr:hypothetical protein [Streptomyces sp. ME19-03-3]MDX3357639.1 hypothetical protein [Streptomyces sp. ME01-24h]